jgi:hypothetical protein
MIGFLAQAWVQEALGVPLNYTEVIESVNQVFAQVGDYARGGSVADLGFILDGGTKVALVYGDRDHVRFMNDSHGLLFIRTYRLVPGYTEKTSASQFHIEMPKASKKLDTKKYRRMARTLEAW